MKIIINTDLEECVMFNAIKFNAKRRHRTSVLGVFFFAAVMVLLPISARAQCSKTWDASGEWEISQGLGAGTVFRLSLKQSGSALSGTAFRQVKSDARDGLATQTETGKVIGDADGDYFTVQIEWASGGELANYRGKILAS